MLIGLDEYGQVRDFYYPHVGEESHTGSTLVHKIGVSLDGVFTWISDDVFDISITYKDETMASYIVATHKKLPIKIIFEDIVYNEEPIFLRKVQIENSSKKAINCALFFNQQFEISEIGRASTAFYDPDSSSIIHYRGRRVFLISGMTDTAKAFDEWSVGLLNSEGHQGTWKDAEDGNLSGNSIEHGLVDSVIRFDMKCPAQGTKQCFYWIIAGKSFDAVHELHAVLHSKGPEHILKTTKDYWRAWIHKRTFNFYGLSPQAAKLFNTSLLVMRTHIDSDGAIIASGDSDLLQHGRDTYAYMWPRDGAFSALALDKAGYFDLSNEFYRFCNSVMTNHGYLLHKYRADTSVGSSWHPWFRDGKKQLAIQEDETALVLYALWRHYSVTKDLEFVESIYNTFIKRAAEFMVIYRDKKTGLPAPSYDLWEEKYGISTFTSASVVGSLHAAGNFAELLGKDADASKYRAEAEHIKASMKKYLFDTENNYFHKLITVENGKICTDSTIDASSFYGIFKFGILPLEDPYLKKAYSYGMEKLTARPIGKGIVRYIGDAYFYTSGNEVGNPWFVTTLWFMQYVIQNAKEENDLAEVRSLFDWIASHTTESGILSEQIDAVNGKQLSVAPLTWSHASYIFTVILYLEKIEELGVCKTCYPMNH